MIDWSFRLPDIYKPTPKIDDSLRILVLGYIVRGPLGGLAWHHLQYVMGLTRLGHDVYFFEDSDNYDSCYDPDRGLMGTDPTYGLGFTAQTFDKAGLTDQWAYYDAHTNSWLGPAADRSLEICGTADLLLNVSGVNPLRPWLMEVPVRAFIDTDPAFTQIRHLTDPAAYQLASQHTHFLTFAENIGRRTCKIPDDHFPWQPTRQPIVLPAWPVLPGPEEGKLTTVMQWDSYATRDFNGVQYGMKSESFAPYLELPTATETAFELALGSASAPRDLLLKKGWQLVDPLTISLTPWSYQDYIQQSKAEFSVAKQGYVISHGGWFSERSACYLASGRPVVVQNTGFSEWMETGAGVIAFSSPDQALAGIAAINGSYHFHCQAARAIAEEYFDARKVLLQLIEFTMQN